MLRGQDLMPTIGYFRKAICSLLISLAECNQGMIEGDPRPMNPLRWIFQFVFGCRHRHMSRVFTIKGRTYKVCFDCGEEFDLPDAHVASAA